MNELLIIILIIVVFVIFKNLNNKIRNLEKQVTDLNSKINARSIHSEPAEQKAASRQDEPSPAISNNEPLRKVVQFNKNNNEQIPVAEPKDWLRPVLDFLKQNALTVIGIFTLVLGIGYFVKYAIDKNWIGEAARAGIGFCTGAGIILTGHFLRKNYATFASIITGGGTAVLYFTATIAFREYHLFTQNTAFGITTLITVISIVLSYYYRSEILIIFSLLGGFSAPLMVSTGQSNYLFLFIYISLLNTGMLAVTFLRHWKSVGWTAFIFTTLYLFTWTSEKTELLSIVFYIITYLIFYLFALQDYIRKNILPVPDILMLALINFTSTIGLVYTFNALKYEPVIIFPLLFAFINTILFFREYTRKSSGTAYSVFAAITVSLLTLAIALQFRTHLITSVWAIEASLLLFIWKKTDQKIFKTCFYILFPLVIIAQILTWTEYFNAKNLSIIVNPVFLTSLVTIISTIFNLYLLKATPETEKKDSFWEASTPVISYGIIYTAILLEIIYHISGMSWAAITHIGLLFSLYYIFVILLFRKKQNISNSLQTGFIYIFLFLLTVNASVSSSSVVTDILFKKLSSGFYFVHLLQWIPFIYIVFQVVPSSGFHKQPVSYWILSLAFTIAVSFGLYHLYIFANTQDISQYYVIKKHFNVLYLPIIWAILASIFIYTGLKKNIQEYNKIGFALIGMMVIKLYAYDVWQMDNISRISAFIILGIILLISSFTFQRLKNMVKNMVDKKEKKKESSDPPSG
ncbi:DUF2339 domain-containing protein [Chryseobacterium gallinarum]|uniref:DUF2339 domain-containing protein n=1 Tax=Chryseobacterium gallinarum TaxID=1324352 RepID=UPI0020248F01|nr:DUF2339 domain-containing protein [Chryseobacterium gallinarum]MCL8537512.1 DUF2339 domain-containing protein [Chryseobacterium gallinarum]